MKDKITTEGYVISGKGIATKVNTSASRTAFWLLPGETVSKKQAPGLARYRKKVHQLRRSAIKQGHLVDVGSHYLVTTTIVFDSVSDVSGFVLGSSRSGDVARKGARALVGKNLVPRAL